MKENDCVGGSKINFEIENYSFFLLQKEGE